MNDFSRGLFDWTCSPSGRLTCNATRASVPAWTPSLSTIGVTSAFGRRICACPIATATSTPMAIRNVRTRLLHFSQGNRTDGHRNGRWIDLALDGPAVLEHEVSLPALGRVRRFEPVPGLQGTAKGQRRDAGEPRRGRV